MKGIHRRLWLVCVLVCVLQARATSLLSRSLDPEHSSRIFPASPSVSKETGEPTERPCANSKHAAFIQVDGGSGRTRKVNCTMPPFVPPPKIRRECPFPGCPPTRQCSDPSWRCCGRGGFCCPPGSSCLVGGKTPSCIREKPNDPQACAEEPCGTDFNCPKKKVGVCCLGGKTCCEFGSVCFNSKVASCRKMSTQELLFKRRYAPLPVVKGLPAATGDVLSDEPNLPFDNRPIRAVPIHRKPMEADGAISTDKEDGKNQKKKTAQKLLKDRLAKLTKDMKRKVKAMKEKPVKVRPATSEVAPMPVVRPQQLVLLEAQARSGQQTLRTKPKKTQRKRKKNKRRQHKRNQRKRKKVKKAKSKAKHRQRKRKQQKKAHLDASTGLPGSIVRGKATIPRKIDVLDKRHKSKETKADSDDEEEKAKALAATKIELKRQLAEQVRELRKKALSSAKTKTTAQKLTQPCGKKTPTKAEGGKNGWAPLVKIVPNPHPVNCKAEKKRQEHIQGHNVIVLKPIQPKQPKQPPPPTVDEYAQDLNAIHRLNKAIHAHARASAARPASHAVKADVGKKEHPHHTIAKRPFKELDDPNAPWNLPLFAHPPHKEGHRQRTKSWKVGNMQIGTTEVQNTVLLANGAMKTHSQTHRVVYQLPKSGKMLSIKQLKAEAIDAMDRASHAEEVVKKVDEDRLPTKAEAELMKKEGRKQLNKKTKSKKNQKNKHKHKHKHQHKHQHKKTKPTKTSHAK